MLIPRTEHVADRPAWTCRVCGANWPCAVAKAELTEQFRAVPTSLALFMASTMVEVIDDLAATPGAAPAGLHDRFLGWLERAGGAGGPGPTG